MIEEEVRTLQKVPMFRDLDPSKLKLLAVLSDRTTFGPDEQIYKQGDVSDSVYILLNGRYRVVMETPAGDVEIAQHVRGTLLGEIGVICDRSRTVSIVAETDVTALRLDRDAFLRLIAQSQEFSLAVMRELGRQVMALNAIVVARAQGASVVACP